jgi:ATP-dependent RNA helicase DeaD
LLVATDVAARGIDVQDVTHVIHYNLPDELENYMHRSGRTARAGKTGMSLAIVHTKDMGRIRQIERSTGRTFKQLQVPNAMEVCEKQLMKLVKRIHDVKVNEKEIEPYLESIYDEFKDLDRDALIHRLVSIEFNRFLEYYKNAPDLNADVRPGKGDTAGGGRAYGDKHSRMFVSIGSKDGLDKGKLLRFICDTTGEKGAIFGRIDVQGVYSFVDVEPDRMEAVMTGLNGAMYQDRKVRTELSESNAGSNGGRTSRSNDSRTRNRDGKNFGGGDKSRGGEGRSYGSDRGRSEGGRERSTERKREMSTEGGRGGSFGRDPWKDDKPAKRSSSGEGKKEKAGAEGSSRKDKYKSRW